MAITQVSNSLVKQDLTISGGTVDNTVIGSGTPAAGTFTTVAGTLASTVTVAEHILTVRYLTHMYSHSKSGVTLSRICSRMSTCEGKLVVGNRLGKY